MIMLGLHGSLSLFFLGGGEGEGKGKRESWGRVIIINAGLNLTTLSLN